MPGLSISKNSELTRGKRIFMKVRISLVLTVVSICLIVFGGLVFSSYKIGYLGSLQSMSTFYYVGIGLLTTSALLAWLSRQELHRLCLAQFVSLVVALWVIPELIGYHPLSGFLSLEFQSFSTAITLTGYLHPVGDLWQQQWPAMPLLGSILSQMVQGRATLSSALFIENYSPALWQLAYSLVVFPLFSHLFPGNRRWAALWLFTIGSWTGLNFFDINSIGAFFFYMILAFSINQKIGKRTLAILVILLVAVSISHPLYSLLAIVASVVLTPRTSRILLPVYGFAFALVWELFFAGAAVGGTITASIHDWLNFGTFFNQSVGLKVASSSFIHSLVARLDIAYVGVLGFAAVIAYAALLKYSRGVENSFKSLFTVVVVVAGVGLLLGPSFGNEALQRIYFLLLPALSCLAISGMKVRRRFFILALVLLLSLGTVTNITTLFGQTAVNNNTPSLDSGYVYFGQFTLGGYYGGTITTFTRNPESYTVVPLFLASGNNITKPQPENYYPYFILLGPADEGRLQYTFGNANAFTQTGEMLGSDPGMILAFNSGDTHIYARAIPP